MTKPIIPRSIVKKAAKESNEMQQKTVEKSKTKPLTKEQENKTAYLKITHPDPKKAKAMAKTLVKFANKLAILMGEKPDAKIITQA